MEAGANIRAELTALRERLDPAFSRDTAYPGSLPSIDANSPASTGHCAIVAAIVHLRFGGDLRRTIMDGEEHWFNFLPVDDSAIEVDLTGDQFGLPPLQIASSGTLYPGFVERPIADLEPEALDRAARLARRAGLLDTAEAVESLIRDAHGRAVRA